MHSLNTFVSWVHVRPETSKLGIKMNQTRMLPLAAGSPAVPMIHAPNIFCYTLADCQL